MDYFSNFCKVYVQLAEKKLPIFPTYNLIKIILIVQFMMNMTLIFPPDENIIDPKIKYVHQVIDTLNYAFQIYDYPQIRELGILAHFFVLSFIFSIQNMQVILKSKQPYLSLLQQYFLQLLPICLFQPIVFLSGLVIHQQQASTFIYAIAIIDLILVYLLLSLTSLLFVCPTQWLLICRPLTFPYGNFNFPQINVQFLTILLISMKVNEYLIYFFLILYFLLPLLQLLLHKYRTVYTDLQLNLSLTNFLIILIYIIRRFIYTHQELNTLSSEEEEFYFFLIFGLFGYSIASQLRDLYFVKNSYQQFGQMLEVDIHQLNFIDNRIFKFDLIQAKRYHDDYLFTPYCPFKKKEVYETWFFNEKASISHFINCIFSQKENLNSVEQSLSSIIFIYHYLKYPLQALLQIYRFQTHTRVLNSYPRMIIQIIKEQIQSSLKQQQTALLTQKLQENEIANQLNVFQYSKSQKLFNTYLQLQKPILQMKINYWSKLIDGYASLDQVKDEILIVVHNTTAIEAFIDDNFDTDKLTYKIKFHEREEDYDFLPSDIIILKILSMYFSYIQNDFRKSFTIEESVKGMLIDTGGSFDKTLNNLTILQKKALLLLTHTFENSGVIINQNKQEISKFLGQEEKDFQFFRNINNLMPKFISVRHDELIENFICRGFSKFFYSTNETFCIDQRGFVIPINLLLGNAFEQNGDFILTANLIRIKEQSDFILFDHQGRILEISQNLFNNHIKRFQKDSYDCISFKDKCFVQFFLSIQVNRIVEQLKQNENLGFCVTEEKVLFQCPRKLDYIQLEFDAYLKKLQQQKIIMSSRRSQTNTKFNTYRTQEGYKLDEADNLAQMDDTSHTIKGSNIDLLNEEYAENVQGFVNDSDLNYHYTNIEPQVLTFSLYFKQLGFDKFPYFIMEISNIKGKQFFTMNSQRPEIKDNSKTNISYNSGDQSQKIKEQEEQMKQQIEEQQSNLTFMQQNEDKAQKQKLNEKKEEKELKKKMSTQKFQEEMDKSALSISEPSSYYKNQFNKDQKSAKHLNFPKQEDESLILGINSQIMSEFAPSSFFSQVQPPSQRAQFHHIATYQKKIDYQDYDIISELDQQNLKCEHDEEEKDQKLSVNKGRDVNFSQQIDFSQEQVEEIDIQQKNSSTPNQKQNREIIVKKGKIVRKRTENEEISILSATSGQTYYFNLMQTKIRKKRMSQELKRLFLLEIALISVFILGIYFNNNILVTRFEAEQKEINSIISPSQFNQFYQELLVYSTILITGEYESTLRHSDYINDFIKYHLANIQGEFQEFYQEIFNSLRGIDQRKDNEKYNISIVNNMNVLQHTGTYIQYLALFSDQLYKTINDLIDPNKKLINNDTLSSILFFRLNIGHQQDIIDQYIQHSEEISKQIDETTTLQITILLGVEIILFIFLFFVQLYYLVKIKIFLESLLLILTQYHQQDGMNAIFQFKQFQQILSTKENLYIYNYSRVFEDSQVNNQTHKFDSKQKLSLSARIPQQNINYWCYIVTFVLIIIILSVTTLGQYLLFKQDEDQLHFLVTFSINSIELKHHIDDLVTQSQVIKTDPILLKEIYKTNSDISDTTNQIFDQLQFNYDSFYFHQERLTSNFFQLKNYNVEDIELLDSLFKDDLCQVTKKAFYFCGSQDPKYKQFGQPHKQENNTLMLNKGLKGIFAQMNQVFSELFTKEIHQKEYQSLDECTIFLQSSTNDVIFISYLLEVQEEMNYFLLSINKKALKLIKDIQSTLEVYQGLSSFLIISTIIILIAYITLKLHFHILRLRKGIILVPYQALLQETLSRAIANKL